MPQLELADCSLFYTRDGEGSPPLVFVHGGFCTHEDWKHQVASLRADHTVVTLDQRCHGASSADPDTCSMSTFAADVHALVAEIGLGPAVLVGHSLGARVVIQAAVDQPERTAGIVLVDGSRQSAATPEAIRRRHEESFANTGASVLVPGFEEMFFDNADPVEKARVLDGLQRTSRETAMALTRATWTWDAGELEHALSQVRVPTLVLQSTYSDGTTPRRRLEIGESSPWIDRIVSYVPGAEVRIVPGVGHFSMFEAPTAITDAIREFADSL